MGDNRDFDYGRCATLASALTEDLRVTLDERRGIHKTNLYDYLSDGSAREHMSDYGSDAESDWMEVTVEIIQIRIPVDRQDHPRFRKPLVPRSNTMYGRRESVYQQERSNSSRKRRIYWPCGACGAMRHEAHFCRRRRKLRIQVHAVGQCELFARFENLAKFVKAMVDKSAKPEDLHDIYLSSH